MAKAAASSLVIGGSPEPSSVELLAMLAAGSDRVIAVDRGIGWCRAAGIVPDLLVGDLDTASPADIAWAREKGVEERVSPAHKDDTDLGIALSLVDEGPVVLSCVSGGSPDHMLAVYGVLSRYAGLKPRIVEDGFECRILSADANPSWDFSYSDQDRRFSLIALTPGCIVSERGMEWELDHAELEPLSDLGVSNLIAAADASVEVHSGTVAAYLFAY